MMVRGLSARVHDAGGIERSAYGAIRLRKEWRPLLAIPGTVVPSDGVVVRDSPAGGDQGVRGGRLDLGPLFEFGTWPTLAEHRVVRRRPVRIHIAEAPRDHAAATDALGGCLGRFHGSVEGCEAIPRDRGLEGLQHQAGAERKASWRWPPAMNAFRQAPAAPRWAASVAVLVPESSIDDRPQNSSQISTAHANHASSPWSADSKVTISRLRVPSLAPLSSAPPDGRATGSWQATDRSGRWSVRRRRHPRSTRTQTAPMLGSGAGPAAASRPV